MSEVKESIFGLIPKKWDVINADEYCQKVTDGTHDSPKESLKGFPLITSKHIKGSEIDFSSAYLISKEDFDNINKRSYVSQWDVIISMIGEYCGFTYLEENSTINYAIKNVGLFKTGNEIDSKWLYYFFQSKSTNYLLNTYRSGTSQPYLSLGVLRKFPILIPENKEEKKEVVLILDSLRKKIELLQAQNKTLEELAQTLFKEWFGKYKVGDKLPEGWKEGKLGEVTKTFGGTTPSTSNPNFWNGEISWTSPKDLSNSKGIFLLETEKKITKEGLKKISSGLLPKKTLLLSSRAPIGYLALTNIELAINQGYIAILPEQYFSNNYMYLWLTENMKLVENASNGSTFMEISKSSFRNIDCVIPNKQIIEKFDNLINPTFEKVLSNSIQIQTLTKTRDALLPKLMSGEIRVKKQFFENFE